jgi:hypothetical protein
MRFGARRLDPRESFGARAFRGVCLSGQLCGALPSIKRATGREVGLQLEVGEGRKPETHRKFNWRV